jgi:hypothetical protein
VTRPRHGCVSGWLRTRVLRPPTSSGGARRRSTVLPQMTSRYRAMRCGARRSRSRASCVPRSTIASGRRCCMDSCVRTPAISSSSQSDQRASALPLATSGCSLQPSNNGRMPKRTLRALTLEHRLGSRPLLALLVLRTRGCCAVGTPPVTRSVRVNSHHCARRRRSTPDAPCGRGHTRTQRPAVARRPNVTATPPNAASLARCLPPRPRENLLVCERNAMAVRGPDGERSCE